MNYIWAMMLLLGIIFSIFTGNIGNFTDLLMESSSRAINFVIGLTGILCLWSGLMNIALKAGLMEKLSKLAMPLMTLLFPEEKNNNILAMMLMSFAANVFGAGNSATVFSLKVMDMLDKENLCRDTASNSMCMFMALSMSMLQLVPITIIKLRTDLSSVDPGSIIIPGILSGLVSMVVSVAICLYFQNREHRL